MTTNTDTNLEPDYFSDTVDRLLKDAKEVIEDHGGEAMSFDDFLSVVLDNEAIEIFYTARPDFDLVEPKLLTHEQYRYVALLQCINIDEAVDKYEDESANAGWQALVSAAESLARLRTLDKFAYSTGLAVDVAQQVRAILSSRARLASAASHAEHRELEQMACEWLDAHFRQDGLTNDRAAEALGKVVPVALSTRQAYVKRWRRIKLLAR
ncbi:hypothetical protein [Paraburkholderia sacchari]|uniref:hypothetical protein n=1 Tax=Paraburkholderia sacchari TaxID=159450 RepID=UPI003D99EDAA